jgi:2-keto-4-pentenoate hydratase/2-oxohepta-3-ene-1,7-dioic acid hydratase in catechol pathway
MRLARVSHQGVPAVAVLDGEALIAQTSGKRLGTVGNIRLLAPCQPSKIVAIGRNYADHAAEFGNTAPDEPLLFLKPPSAVIGPEAPIRYPRLSHHVDHEAELAVVIGKPAWRVPAARADEYILGYTCGNDITARDLQQEDAQWTRAKGFDSFCPLGPWIETELDPGQLRIRCRVNGETRQVGHTSDMVHAIPYLIEYITQVMTLEMGDVILTGTPAGVGPLKPGDQVEVEIEQIGILRNTIVADR